ncbi:hypothetical protein WA171_004073 [Blastocystis sp. BT1]
MHILVETLNGKRLYLLCLILLGTSAFSVEPTSTAADIKSMVQEQEGIAVEAQRIVFSGKQLDDSCILADYNVQDDSTLTVALRVLGGGKVHGSLTRAGKVRNQTPKVEKQEKGKSHVGRAKKREQYNRRYVNVVLAPGAKRVGPNNFAARQARMEAAAKKE